MNTTLPSKKSEYSIYKKMIRETEFKSWYTKAVLSQVMIRIESLVRNYIEPKEIENVFLDVAEIKSISKEFRSNKLDVYYENLIEGETNSDKAIGKGFRQDNRAMLLSSRFLKLFFLNRFARKSKKPDKKMLMDETLTLIYKLDINLGHILFKPQHQKDKKEVIRVLLVWSKLKDKLLEKQASYMVRFARNKLQGENFKKSRIWKSRSFSQLEEKENISRFRLISSYSKKGDCLVFVPVDEDKSTRGKDSEKRMDGVLLYLPRLDEIDEKILSARSRVERPLWIESIKNSVGSIYVYFYVYLREVPKLVAGKSGLDTKLVDEINVRASEIKEINNESSINAIRELGENREEIEDYIKKKVGRQISKALKQMKSSKVPVDDVNITIQLPDCGYYTKEIVKDAIKDKLSRKGIKEGIEILILPPVDAETLEYNEAPYLNTWDDFEVEK